MPGYFASAVCRTRNKLIALCFVDPDAVPLFVEHNRSRFFEPVSAQLWFDYALIVFREHGRLLKPGLCFRTVELEKARLSIILLRQRAISERCDACRTVLIVALLCNGQIL